MHSLIIDFINFCLAFIDYKKVFFDLPCNESKDEYLEIWIT